MGHSLHPDVRRTPKTPKTRAEIQSSGARVAEMARLGTVSEVTIRHRRGRRTHADSGHVRHDLGQSTMPGQEALIGELRRFARLGLSDITEVMNRCTTPKLSESAVWRRLRRIGQGGPHDALRAGAAAAQPDQDAGDVKKPSRAFVRLCSVKTACAMVDGRRAVAVSLLEASTPLKNVAHGLMRT